MIVADPQGSPLPQSDKDKLALPSQEVPVMFQHSYLIGSESLMIWRFFQAVFHACAFTAELVMEQAPKLFIYFTYWGFLMSLLYFFLAVLIQMRFATKHSTNNNFSPMFRSICRFTHALFEVTFSIELTIVIMYWGFLSKPASEFVSGPYQDQATNIYKHGMIWLMLWLEHILSNHRFYPLHAIWVVLIFFVYLVPNLIYTLVHEPVYKIFTYKDAKTYIYCAIVIAISLVHFAIGYILSRWKARKIAEAEGIKRNGVFHETSNQSH